jgi:cytochrome c oxidase assembly protein subunit 15
MTLLQVAMGTQVREAVDFIAREHIERQYWREDFPIIFYIHRSFSSIILFTNLWLVWKIYQSVDKQNLLFRTGLALAGLVITAILAGISLDRLGVPAFVQPIHLLVASMIFGVQFFIYSCLNYAATALSGRERELNVALLLSHSISNKISPNPSFSKRGTE